MPKEVIYDIEEFELSLRAYLNYVSRKLKKDENYNPHPIIMSLANAIEGSRSKGEPGVYAGLSGDSELYPDGEARKLIASLIEVHKDMTITIIKIDDLSNKRPIPIKVVSYAILLSIQLDRFLGDDINVDDFIELVNKSIPQINIIKFNNDEWKEARDYLAENIHNIHVHNELRSEFESEFGSIRESTLWEEYPSNVRMTIATTWMREKYANLFKEDVINIVNVHICDRYPKIKMLNSVLDFLYGQSSSFFDDIVKWPLFEDLNKFTDPSYKRIKIGRNDPCYCGSGKKYKKCCLP